MALTENLVHFTRYLRARGLSVVPETTADLHRAARTVGLADRDDLKSAFRAVAVTRPEDLPVFDQAFELFFGDASPPRKRPDDIEFRIHDRSRFQAQVPVLASPGGGDGEGRDDLEERGGGSYLERLMRKDFSTLTAEERAEVRRIIARMMWQPADALSRRHAAARRGSRPDFRRSLRRMVGPDGELMLLSYTSRTPRPRPLIVLADVSGSMERFSEMLLYFMHAAQGRLGRLEAFVFATRLSRITREIRHRDPTEAVRRVADHVHDWSGGTRIGEALAEFNLAWSRRVARGGPIALVISDGWDTGDPDLLGVEMGRFARSMHRVVWLNPLAGRAGYEPATRGMRAALPHVDHFLPAASVTDLRDVVRLLESVPARRRDVVRTGALR
jgi:uncharacterized protein with von Willebrand factor type A (vWA) domain